MPSAMSRGPLYLVVALLGLGIVLASWSFGQQQSSSGTLGDAVKNLNSCETQWGLCRKNCADKHEKGFMYEVCKEICDSNYTECIKNEKGKGSIQRGGSSPSGGKIHNLEPVTTATPK